VPFRTLDLAIVGCLAVAALQLVPLPYAARERISPAAVAFERTVRIQSSGGGARPLSIDPTATALALAVGAGLASVFWSARSMFARGGLRGVTRAVAVMGLIVAPLAIVQHATAPFLLYWHWRPITKDAQPYGPFVNRNDFACWLVMALPLVVGYGMARVRSRLRSGHGAVDLEDAVDETEVALAVSACLMAGALFVSMSRSGLTAAAVSLLTLVWLARRHIDRQRLVWLLLALAGLVVVATTYANLDALATRVGDAFAEGGGGRRAIWRETWPMVKDFAATGVGVGAYQRGMLVYQQSPRKFYFNHAHDEYLQILAEGGLVLAAPVLVALVSFVAGVVRRLREDRSAVYWMRAGAVSGMVAAAVQSVWDTGLRMPANAVLFGILAAIALHDSRTRSSAGANSLTRTRA